MSDLTGEKQTGLRERVRERMRAEGIPVGTTDPTLLALGAAPFCPVEPCLGLGCHLRMEAPATPAWMAYEQGCIEVRRLVDG